MSQHTHMVEIFLLPTSGCKLSFFPSAVLHVALIVHVDGHRAVEHQRAVVLYLQCSLVIVDAKSSITYPSATLKHYRCCQSMIERAIPVLTAKLYAPPR